MVELVAKIQSQNGVRTTTPLIVELVGLAGAGKTTLSRTLLQRDARVQIGADIELRKLRHIPLFLRNMPSAMSLFLPRPRADRSLTWTELKDIAYLKGWAGLLKRQMPNAGNVILLDQGPVYRLATLREFGPEVLKSKRFNAWWDSLYKQWASALDMVVWLDAPDEVLTGRIKTRAKKHDVKGKSDFEAEQYLRRYRKSYISVLTKLVLNNGPVILQFDTHKASIEHVADKILAACRSKAHGS